MFKEDITENTEVKKLLEEFIVQNTDLGTDTQVVDVTQPDSSSTEASEPVEDSMATDAPVQGPAVQTDRDKQIEHICQCLAELDYTPSYFSTTVMPTVKPLFEKFAKEKETRLREERIGSTQSITGYNHGYNDRGASISNMSYMNYKMEPSNNFPYKSPAGYVGLKNQGATCYLNSLIQALYHTPSFRRSILQWQYDPKVHKKESKCIPLQLQKLFANLRLSESKSVETKDLTESFGWTSREVFVQHDVQELLRVLFDSLSSEKLPINDLYEGTMRDYVICTECKRVGGRKDNYLDLQLVIQGAKHLDDALDNFQFEEMLEGSNQYFCEKCNKKVDAKKGLKILSTPDILTLHLKRFDIDYNTMNRVKLNNEVIFPLTLDMNKHLKSTNSFESSDMDVADIDSKYNIYNLYAVLMHSGSVGGGHYYAYIRIKDKWYEFNDSTVSVISENEVEKAFGGTTSYANGYMLMYVRQFPLSEVHLKSLKLLDQDEASIIPENIRDEILKENVTYNNGQKEYELKRSKMEFKVHYNDVEHTISLEKDKTVKDLLQSAIDSAFKNSDKPKIENARLRKYDVAKTIPKEPLESLEDLLEKVDVTKDKLLLEVKRDAEEFAAYRPETEYMIKVIKFTSPDHFQSALPVYVPHNATLADLKSLLEPIVHIPQDRQRLVVKIFMNVTQQEKMLTGDNKALHDLKVQPGDTLYVEQADENENDNNGVITALENARNQIKIKYQVAYSFKGVNLPSDAVKDNNGRVIVPMDRRATIADLKSVISKQIQVSEDNFILSKGSDDTSYTFNDTDEKLLQLVDGCSLYVKQGQQMSKQQFNVTFYLFEEKKKEPSSSYNSAASNHSQYAYKFAPMRVEFEDSDEDYSSMWRSHNPFKRLFDTLLDKNVTVEQVKELLIQKGKEEKHGMITSETTTDNIQLREKLHGRNYPGKILLGDDNVYEALSGSATSSVPNREIIIQKVALKSHITSEDMVLRLARFGPSDWKMYRRHEIVIGKDATILELKHFALNEAQRYGFMELTPDDVDVARIPYQMASLLKNNEFMLKLNWQDTKPDQFITKAPWFLDDGDLVLWKFTNEKDWWTVNDKQTPKTTVVNTAAAASVKPEPDTVAGVGQLPLPRPMNGFSNRESALRFYDDEEKETKVEEKAKITEPVEQKRDDDMDTEMSGTDETTH